MRTSLSVVYPSARLCALALCMCAAILCTNRSPAAEPLKPRMVVLTDVSTWETDDSESLVRLFVHADLLEIEGLIYTTGWSLDKIREDFLSLIHSPIDAYEKDLPNLLKRSHQTGHALDNQPEPIGYWPSAGALRERTVIGSRQRGIEHLGEGNDSDGSNLIIKLADEPDERPLWVTVWGGGNTLAQAIWRVQHDRSPAEFTAFLKKLRVYTITDQDREQRTPFSDSSHPWIRRQCGRDLIFLWDECAWKYQNGNGKRNWEQYAQHIQNHGHLGSVYPKYKYGVEGDTPAFLHLLPIGLNDPQSPTQGGWGGYFQYGLSEDGETSCYNNHAGKTKQVCSDLTKHFYEAEFNNFAARMDWAASGTGNRNPVVKIGEAAGLDAVHLIATPGTSVALDASASLDPDGDRLQFQWWMIPEAGSYAGQLEITNSTDSRASLTLPADSAGKQIHVICEVTDTGSPQLTSYRRIIIEPAATAAQPQRVIPEKSRLRVVVTTDFPPIDVVKSGDVPPDHKSDPDDLQSIVRFLLVANEFDVEGLMASAGTFANVARKQNILDVIDRYEQVYPHLKTHAKGYPTPDSLRAVTYEGRDGTWGKKGTENIGVGRDSPASDALIAIVDKPDPRPVYVCVWGDSSIVAQAIWKVQQTRSQAALDQFLAKLRVHQIATQDGTIDWLRENFPQLFIIHSVKTYFGMFGGSDPISDLAWVEKHIRRERGPLCALYPKEGIGCTGVCEGDSPSFLWLLSAARGLNDPEDPTQPSWGGQFVRDGDKNHYIDGPGPASISKWRAEFQADFQQRAQWCVP